MEKGWKTRADVLACAPLVTHNLSKEYGTSKLQCMRFTQAGKRIKRKIERNKNRTRNGIRILSEPRHFVSGILFRTNRETKIHRSATRDCRGVSNTSMRLSRIETSRSTDAFSCPRHRSAAPAPAQRTARRARPRVGGSWLLDTQHEVSGAARNGVSVTGAYIGAIVPE
jgi:hypothetical protein